MKRLFFLSLCALFQTACADDPATPADGGNSGPPTLASSIVLNTCGQLSGVTLTASISNPANASGMTPESLAIEGGTGTMAFENASVASGTSLSYECHNGISFDTAPADGATVTVTLSYRNAGETASKTVTASATVSAVAASDNCDTAFETDVVACAIASN